ncbi:MAG: EVE domain-containing protein [Desulfobacterales bacterium]
MAVERKYWLVKSEPEVFSIDDLMESPCETTSWDGVRNYQARNFMRDEMKIGDSVLFYHSGKNPSVVGTARVAKEGYPDHTAWDDQSSHFDPKSTPENPIWYMVDIQLEKKFSKPFSLKALRGVKGLEEMILLKKGMRLSVQPVTKDQFDIITSLG